MVVHAFNPSTWKAEAGRPLWDLWDLWHQDLRPAWFTKWVPSQLGIYIERPCLKNKQTNKQTNSPQIRRRRERTGSRLLPVGLRQEESPPIVFLLSQLQGCYRNLQSIQILGKILSLAFSDMLRMKTKISLLVKKSHFASWKKKKSLNLLHFHLLYTRV